MICAVVAIPVIIIVIIGIVLIVKNKNEPKGVSFTKDNTDIVDGVITSWGAVHDSFSAKYSYSYKVDGIECTNTEWVNKWKFKEAYDVDLVSINLVKYQPIRVIYKG